MQQVKQLSPKKYIETKVRNLPIYKCLVNKNWKDAKIADVIVMRKHANGNITAGIYLVDLLCLGVKETFFFFNQSEEHVMSKFYLTEDMPEEIDYATAHNIIYAGHDFAMDCDIHPHKDFAITKYILQDDNDTVPLIDIAVGDIEGKPHLILHTPGQHLEALSKLKKNAGEGNYNYTIGVGIEGDEEYDDEDGDVTYSDSLDDYEPGRITPWAARHINSKELSGPLPENRTLPEQMTLLIESLIRLINIISPGYIAEVEEAWEYKYNQKALSMYDNPIQQEYLQAIAEIASALKAEMSDEESDDKKGGLFLDLLEKYSHNSLIVSAIYEKSFMGNREPSLSVAKTCLQNLSAIFTPSILSIALCSLFDEQKESNYDFIYNSPHIEQIFCKPSDWHIHSLGTFWLIQTVVHSRKGDLKKAIQYYDLFANTRAFSFMLVEVQNELSTLLKEKLNSENVEKKSF